MSSKPTLVDLFCGCGGFGLGGELAGFHTVAAVDIDATLQSAYEKNFPNTAVVNRDLSSMELFDWKCILANQEIDGVIGGPPCQGYSRMGVRDIKDPRRKLLEHFFRHVNLIAPKFFIMENVEGILDEKNRPQLDKAIGIIHNKYTVLEPLIVDAADFGAATKRRRVIIVGFDKTRMNSVSKSNFVIKKNFTTISDAISDIPEPIPQNKNDLSLGYSAYKPVTKLSKYAKEMRQNAPSGLGSTEVKQNLINGYVSGVFDTIHTEKVRLRYKNTPPGMTDPVSRSKKLSWDGYSPTLRAGTGSDKGSYQAVRPLHPDSGRVITVREAARLQGFPDWFCFHPTKWHSFRMIGNSVSPIVSKALLKTLKDSLNRNSTGLNKLVSD